MPTTPPLSAHRASRRSARPCALRCADRCAYRFERHGHRRRKRLRQLNRHTGYNRTLLKAEREQHQTSRTTPRARPRHLTGWSGRRIRCLEHTDPKAGKAAMDQAGPQSLGSSRDTRRRPWLRRYCALGARAEWFPPRRLGHIHRRPENGAIRSPHKALQAFEPSSSPGLNSRRLRTARGWPTADFSHRPAERIAWAKIPC